MLIYPPADFVHFLMYSFVFNMNESIIISPGYHYEPVQSWPPKIGISFLKIKAPEVPGQYVTVEGRCVRHLQNHWFALRIRMCVDKMNISPGKLTYIQLPETRREFIRFFFRCVSTTNENVKPQPVTYELITDDEEVKKIQNFIFDLAL